MNIHQLLKYHLFFLMCFGGFWVSCTEPVNVPGLNDQSNQLVVDALFTSESRVHTIYLSRSTAVDNVSFPKETGATVYIIDDQNNRIDFAEGEPGSYFSPEVPAQPERVYTLHITTTNGSRYISQPQTLTNTPAPIKSLTVIDGSEVDDNGNVVESARIEVTFEDPANEENYYYWYWQSDSLGQFGIPDITWRSATASDELFNGNEATVSLEEDFTRVSDRFVKVYQASINRDAYTFLISLRQQIGSEQLPIFLPGRPLESNLTNENDPKELVLGYFVLANVTADTVRLAP